MHTDMRHKYFTSCHELIDNLHMRCFLTKSGDKIIRAITLNKTTEFSKFEQCWKYLKKCQHTTKQNIVLDKLKGKSYIL